jgi:hypothetical protein
MRGVNRLGFSVSVNDYTIRHSLFHVTVAKKNLIEIVSNANIWGNSMQSAPQWSHRS